MAHKGLPTTAQLNARFRKSTDRRSGVYAVRCFVNDRRVYTHLLTKAEAKIFLKGAQLLARYLKSSYQLKERSSR